MAKKVKKTGKKGGVRVGAGRKATFGEPMKGLYVSLPFAAILELESRAKQDGVKPVAIVRAIVCGALGVCG